MTTVANDGQSFICCEVACARYGLTRQELRKLVRRHGLTTYRPVTADRRHYLRRDALETIPGLSKAAARPTLAIRTRIGVNSRRGRCG